MTNHWYSQTIVDHQPHQLGWVFELLNIPQVVGEKVEFEAGDVPGIRGLPPGQNAGIPQLDLLVYKSANNLAVIWWFLKRGVPPNHSFLTTWK